MIAITVDAVDDTMAEAMVAAIDMVVMTIEKVKVSIRHLAIPTTAVTTTAPPAIVIASVTMIVIEARSEVDPALTMMEIRRVMEIDTAAVDTMIGTVIEIEIATEIVPTTDTMSVVETIVIRVSEAVADEVDTVVSMIEVDTEEEEEDVEVFVAVVDTS